MTALSKIVRSGVGRRRIQSLVLTATTLAAVTSSILSLGLLASVQAPFDHAVRDRNAAHLAVSFDGAKATADQLAATAHAAGVTQAAGPYPIAANLSTMTGGDCTFKDAGGFSFANTPGPPADVTARPDLANLPMDKLLQIDGRLPSTAGEIALMGWPWPCRDKTVVFDKLPGKPSFKVVGIYYSLTGTATGFLTPDGFARLAAAGAKTDLQMLYRFQQAATDTELAADKKAIVAAAPAGSLEGAQSYLRAKQQATGNAKVFVPFLVVFGILGLFLSVLIIAIVVSGAVVSAIRRIGILKAVGFTPLQVARAYAAQALIPATLGIVLGAVFGNVLAIPVLNGSSHELGAGNASIPVWVDVLVPLGTMFLVTVTALVPALRAARLSAARTLVVGRTPKAERGRAAQRLAARLPLPRPLSLGLAQPFAKPARTAMVGAAVLFGVVSATFALGLEGGFANFQEQRGGAGFETGAAVVRAAGDGVDGSGPFFGHNDPRTPRMDAAKTANAIAGIPGTKAFFGWGQTDATIVGAGSDSEVDTVSGDISWAPYPMLAGRWFTAPGEAVVADRLSANASIHVGDTVTAVQLGKSVALKVVGVAFDLHDGGRELVTDSASFTAAGLIPRTEQFNVQLASNADAQTWLASANAALNPLKAKAEPNPGGRGSDVVIVMSALVATLTVMLVVVAALGVLNTVVQDTRERIHDLGIFKALGMSPKQAIAMVLTSVSVTGLLAGLIGVPIGIAVEKAVLKPMQDAIGMHLPASVTATYTPALVLPLLLGGVVIALVGALLPAGWAAKARTVTALRTE